MQDRISALMDGELDDRDAGDAIDTLGREHAALEAWRTYHLIGDAMRMSHRLTAEPGLAPVRLAARPRLRFALPLAASAAAVALVGWVAFAPQQAAPPALAPVVAEAKPPVMVPLSAAANDYLLAHQGFSPRVSFQGMAPYVRTVSDQGQEKRR
ncbi:MAG TPA: sigma-E factor negative regulatory protein [Burkholderiales bacterium]|nr:sigma-E factor negative regulatory protein [Burkholderiales bacterium]